MGRIARFLFAILLAVTATGCESVHTARLIGKNPVSLSPKAWEGLWIGEWIGSSTNPTRLFPSLSS